MSVFQTQAGILKTATVALDSTNATTIVNGGSTGCTVEYVRAVEMANSTATLILDIYRSSTSYKIRGVKAMAAYEVYVDNNPIQLEAGDLLRATAGTADKIHVTASYTVPAV